MMRFHAANLIQKLLEQDKFATRHRASVVCKNFIKPGKNGKHSVSLRVVSVELSSKTSMYTRCVHGVIKFWNIIRRLAGEGEEHI